MTSLRQLRVHSALVATRLADVAIRELFDPDWYGAAYPDVAGAGSNALEHYLLVGGAEGHNPNALFDGVWYREQHPDLELTPLEDYLQRGVANGWDPNPLFDTDWYLERNPDVAAAGANPLAHYIHCGASEGRDPHPLFSSSWYVEQHPPVALINPLEHYLRWGAAHGLSPHPLFDASWYAEQAPDVAAGSLLPHYLERGAATGYDPHPLFSTLWYLAGNPDVASAGINPLEHYLRFGASEGRDPHPLFASRWYLSQIPAVPASHDSPVIHYLQKGAREGRSPHPLFDPAFYLGQLSNPELARGAPVEHYLSLGWKRGLKPHPDFDPSFYLREYADVRGAGTEPLIHFVVHGRAEGRRGTLAAVGPQPGADAVLAPEDAVFPTPPTAEVIEVSPLPGVIKLAVSVLLYHREDLLRNFLGRLLPQIERAREEASLLPELYLSFNYRPSPETHAEIHRLIAEHLFDSSAVHLIERGWNSGFGAGHNAVLHRADCDLLVLLNSDVVVQQDDWLQRIADRFRSDNVAIVGLETSAAQLRADGCGIPVQEGQEVDFVDASVMAIRADLGARFGLFSSAFDYFYFEDADLCLRYRQMGLELARVDLPHEHDRSASSRLLPRYAVGNVLNRNRARFFARWGNYLETRQLPNRLAVRFVEADRQFQCASLPALFALLAEHPTAILDLAGIHQQLLPLFRHRRIRIIPSWQTLNRADYARFYEIEQSTASDESRPSEVARLLGCTPDFEGARMHLRKLVEEAGTDAAGEAMVYVSRRSPLFAGREPAAADWAALEPALSAHGLRSAFYTELATFELEELEGFHRRETHCVTSASAVDLLATIARSEILLCGDHWVGELCQLIGTKTFFWLGAISPTRAMWNHQCAGFFHDRALPCLGCFHRYGEGERNTCLRGDLACLQTSLVDAVAEGLDRFLNGARTTAAEIVEPQLCEPAARPKASAVLSLDAWPKSSAASVLVLIPINPLLDAESIERARELADRAIDGMRTSRVVLDSAGEAPLRGLPHPLRQAAMAAIRQGMIERHLRHERWVFWIDSDIVDYPTSLIDELIGRAEGGIAAPLVLMEGQRREPLSNEFGFGPGRFYDVAGFVEQGHWARFTPPYFDQPGPVFQLDSVGSCYLVNADLYRHGAKHSLDSASQAFNESGAPWPADAISRNQAGPANSFTEHYSVCEFARRAALPVQAFADLIVYHERPPLPS